MADYRFVTVWRIRAPIDAVWDAIVHSERWPTWWRGVESVEKLRPGGEDDIGEVRRYVFRSRLPYRLSFEMTLVGREEPRLLEGQAVGELTGTGRWDLRESDGGTEVTYTWEVRTTKRWMNLLAPLLRPLFVLNHDWVMRQGEIGLRRLLERSSGSPQPAAADPTG